MLMMEKTFHVIFVILILATALFFEESYRKTGRMSPTGQIIDMGGIAEVNEANGERITTYHSSFMVTNNDFSPQLSSVFNHIRHYRDLTIKHWEDNIKELSRLDSQLEAGKIQAIIQSDIDAVKERYPQMEKILRDHKSLVGDIMDDDDLSQTRQIEMITERIQKELDINLNDFIARHQDFADDLKLLMQQRQILRESIVLSQGAMDEQLGDLSQLMISNGPQNDELHQRVENRNKILIENMKISKEQMDTYNKAVEDYIGQVAQETNQLVHETQ